METGLLGQAAGWRMKTQVMARSGQLRRREVKLMRRLRYGWHQVAMKVDDHTPRIIPRWILDNEDPFGQPRVPERHDACARPLLIGVAFQLKPGKQVLKLRDVEIVDYPWKGKPRRQASSQLRLRGTHQ